VELGGSQVPIVAATGPKEREQIAGSCQLPTGLQSAATVACAADRWVAPVRAD